MSPGNLIHGAAGGAFNEGPPACRPRHQACRIASLILSGVMGSWYSLAPVSSKTAFAITAPMQTMAGSPPPWGAASVSMSTVSISGSREKRAQVNYNLDNSPYPPRTREAQRIQLPCCQPIRTKNFFPRRDGHNFFLTQRQKLVKIILTERSVKFIMIKVIGSPCPKKLTSSKSPLTFSPKEGSGTPLCQISAK
jgi:hypothetical protein